MVPEGLKRRRMAQIDESVPEIEAPPQQIEDSVALKEERYKWELQRTELLSQIDDLQLLNSVTRGECG